MHANKGSILSLKPKMDGTWDPEIQSVEETTNILKLCAHTRPWNWGVLLIWVKRRMSPLTWFSYFRFMITFCARFTFARFITTDSVIFIIFVISTKIRSKSWSSNSFLCLKHAIRAPVVQAARESFWGEGANGKFGMCHCFPQYFKVHRVFC